ncbi:MAG: site-2 protease family protein [Oscillospiraceae bacterium]|nr:site-2 protease family protein [Oscillospiraceae bacterium]
MNNALIQSLYRYLIYGIALLTALPFHECAHAWTANKLGDPTARINGRMTLNPLAHLDPFGALLMIFTGIGWAKPVPINARNFKHPKWEMAISSLAGPVSNLLLAYLSMILWKITTIVSYYHSGFFVQNLITIFATMVSINIGLAVFNFIPIPPLDGSRILSLFLPERTYFSIMRYERYAMLALMIAVYFGLLDGPLGFFRHLALNSINFLTGWIDLIWRLFL